MITRRPAAIMAAMAALLVPAVARAQGKAHRIAIQVSAGDPATMTLALHNAQNAIDLFKSRGAPASVEIVAYGPGLTMLRADTSPVKAMLVKMKAADSGLVLSACNNTLMAMSHAEGHAIPLLPEARVVPSGIVRLVELQEAGWSYIRP